MALGTITTVAQGKIIVLATGKMTRLEPSKEPRLGEIGTFCDVRNMHGAFANYDGFIVTVVEDGVAVGKGRLRVTDAMLKRDKFEITNYAQNVQ